jgi:alkylation response protein AidB-like acyl-CoA dehydrogenase
VAIDFTFPPEIDEIRFRVRDFLDQVVRPIEAKAEADDWGRDDWVKAIIDMRGAAHERGLWLPHMPKEWGGKHFVANSLWRIIDRAIQVHGALGYSSDTPLGEMVTQARWNRFADGADEIHQMRIAQRTTAYQDHGTTKAATGNLPL